MGCSKGGLFIDNGWLKTSQTLDFTMRLVVLLPLSLSGQLSQEETNFIFQAETFETNSIIQAET